MDIVFCGICEFNQILRLKIFINEIKLTSIESQGNFLHVQLIPFPNINEIKRKNYLKSGHRAGERSGPNMAAELWWNGDWNTQKCPPNSTQQNGRPCRYSCRQSNWEITKISSHYHFPVPMGLDFENSQITNRQGNHLQINDEKWIIRLNIT